MKWSLLTIALSVFSSVSPQNDKQKYPTPEFENEIYCFNKENNSLIRLEKGNSGIKSKAKLGYNIFPEEGTRKVVLQSGSGMRILGKTKQSKKYIFSVRKIRAGYQELLIDKPLPKGEYIFMVMGGFEINLDGSATLFAFGID